MLVAVHVMKRKVIWKRKEVLHIQMTSSEKHFNLDGGLEVPGCWTTEVREGGATLTDLWPPKTILSSAWLIAVFIHFLYMYAGANLEPTQSHLMLLITLHRCWNLSLRLRVIYACRERGCNVHQTGLGLRLYAKRARTFWCPEIVLETMECSRLAIHLLIRIMSINMMSLMSPLLCDGRRKRRHFRSWWEALE